MTFGTLFRELRIKNKETLRGYCKKRGLDAANICRIEKNLIPPPTTYKRLQHLMSDFKYSPLDMDFLLTACMNYHIAKAVKRFEV